MPRWTLAVTILLTVAWIVSSGDQTTSETQVEMDLREQPASKDSTAPVIQYKDIPADEQFIPDQDSLAQDKATEKAASNAQSDGGFPTGNQDNPTRVLQDRLSRAAKDHDLTTQTQQSSHTPDSSEQQQKHSVDSIKHQDPVAQQERTDVESSANDRGTREVDATMAQDSVAHDSDADPASPAAAQARVARDLTQDSTTPRTRSMMVGAVLSAEQYGLAFQEAVEQANSGEDLTAAKIHLNSTFILMADNPIRAAKAICESLIPYQVSVVIASHPPHSDLSPMAVSFTCGFYNIPVIGISARNSAFSDKNVHTSFMRTVAPYSDQAAVWVDVVSHFGWKKIVFIHSSDEEGRAMLGRFQNKAEDRGIEMERSIQYTAGQTVYDEELEQLLHVQSRIFLLYAKTEDADLIFEEAALKNLTGSGYAWIVTEQALHSAFVPQGTIGLEQLNSGNEAGHIADSVRILGRALRDMVEAGEEISEPPSRCNRIAKSFESGQTIIKYMKRQTLEDGQTGPVQFSSDGDRLNPMYNVINVKFSENSHKPQLATVGTYSAMQDPKLALDEKAIVWPGNQTIHPKGLKISTHLRVVTMLEVPFIYANPAQSADQCEVELNKIPCPMPNKTGHSTMYCCFGYAIDLLVKLSKTVNFTYDLHLSEDNMYGSYERRNSTRKEWNGMIGEIVHSRSDMIVAPLTINPERAEHIDFSKPFKYQGLTILVKKTTKDSNLASFLQPFQNTLWILVGLSVHVVALVLYLLDRFSPFGRFKLAKSDDTEEDALNLSSAMWFAWGVLLNSGIGEGTPRSFSARVLGMVWAGFAMIIVASYTANLAAFLVLDRPEASISGIDDARLRNPQEGFKYATVKGSAVAMYFKRQVELSTMYRTMEGRNYETAEEAIMQVKSGDLQAFIWDSSRLEYEAANDCDLVTAGELFGRSGYGIGLAKDSPWTHDISLAILSFHERGTMEQLDGKWILVKDTKCPEKDTSPATLGLTNMAGVFMMVAGGIVAGVFLIFVEIAYKKHRGLKEKELELAKTAADRWRGNIEKRRTLRRTLLQQQSERRKTNGTTRGSPGPGGREPGQPGPYQRVASAAPSIQTVSARSTPSLDARGGARPRNQIPAV